VDEAVRCEGCVRLERELVGLRRQMAALGTTLVVASRIGADELAVEHEQDIPVAVGQ
jgi:hypothetical protein